MGARQREESINEKPDEPSDVVMEQKEEEEDSGIPGLNRPVQKGDDSWAANLTPGEMILLGNKIRKMLRDTGKTTVDRDGWFGPVGAGGDSGDVLFHNVRWWSRPCGGDSFRIKWDRPLDDRRKTVLLYRLGYVQVLDEDVAMQQLETRAPTNDRENQFLIIARPIPGPRSKLAFNSTYRGRDPGPSATARVTEMARVEESAVPVRTAGGALWARVVMSATQTSTSVDVALDTLRRDIMEKEQLSRHLPPRQPV